MGYDPSLSLCGQEPTRLSISSSKNIRLIQNIQTSVGSCQQRPAKTDPFTKKHPEVTDSSEKPAQHIKYLLEELRFLDLQWTKLK